MWKEWGEPFLIAALIAMTIRTFIFGPYKIPTGSMIPTLLVGDRIFVDKITYRFRQPNRGEIIVFKYPGDEKKDFIKRLVAMSGDSVEIRDGEALVNGKPLTELVDPKVPKKYYYNRNDWSYGREGQKFVVPPDSFFVLGDNSAQSSDSRNWGFVSKRHLIGRAVLIWWPLKRIGFSN
ncbi:MAG: signal peptidase I [Omnitrophica bacterium RIFCSPLOWO2_12_FULL_44_17]|uniref:Signal peptidase I n=1 Tax=Candidatus Danuiimicrobium aquiferis TaxID=1801832 RepID=A0A1G1KRP1_9BACT|nr:MAG: signal peptidase I [Omnitrophica bacterium RIFCSPHIGHO2_02_FULL_45_28]OGW89514.1 MAG: signal peptidase I [Omnitrophica bacterium RIFCSPHIGHO2_12_FULL_44_12]OGW95485.1 MAG: signal peptidase I [Omnitrophica bacterium RIFCSPLOWO2_12_FULL_44_17]OGX03363.1 MAG: signal peptidase I [Omnitrophica bacterium RIFCSPLOWO2_02_FULL_44_11]